MDPGVMEGAAVSGYLFLTSEDVQGGTVPEGLAKFLDGDGGGVV